MGSSLLGKFKGLLSRQKKSKIASQEPAADATANLSRIGMAVKTGAQPAVDPAQASGSATPPDVQLAQSQPAAAEVSDVGIQFFAELPLQHSAEEIVTVSRRAKNCLTAEAQPVGEGFWSVAITLSMQPIPQEIHKIEATLEAWAGKLGGSSKGWGLSQGQAA
jgi:hypothetical protein